MLLLILSGERSGVLLLLLLPSNYRLIVQLSLQPLESMFEKFEQELFFVVA